ncbi:hypothetical protein N7528_003912 [Penicillium herquei]|nr:hypothetical protein N7528_003912 [Penicillium herquei]
MAGSQPFGLPRRAQPYRLSRGSCTDYAWGSSCPQYCKDAQPSAGASVVWLTNGTTGGSTGDETEYCCNSVIISVNDTLVCSKIDGNTQNPFTLNSTGHIIAGVAGLEGLVETSDANSSTITNSTGNTCTTASSNNGDSSKEIAIGAGVGVPLGVIALLSIGWALYERRKRLNTQETTYIHPSIATEERPYSELNSIRGPVPVELSSSPLSDLT